MFYISTPSGGIRLLIANFTNAFLTGKIPGDYNFLIPKISMSTSKSSKLTLALKLTLGTETLKLKSCSTIQKAHKILPHYGSPSLK